MKKISFLAVLFISVHSFAQSNQSKADTSDRAQFENRQAYDFILDYEVPSSPAFTILDATPQQVTRGSAAKPLVVNAFSNFLQTGKLDPGIAVDFSPYILLGGGFQNLKQYHDNAALRILANTTLSAAVIKNSKDTVNTDIGIGLRINLFDAHDLFARENKQLVDGIGNILADHAKAPVTAGAVPDDETGTENVKIEDLSEFYKSAYEAINKKAGWAMSLGFAYRTTAKSSVLVSDSLINRQSRLWLSTTRYTAGGANFYGTLQGRFMENNKPQWIAGIAVGSKIKTSNMGAELLYDFLSKEWNYGANFEIKILKQFSYVISLGKRSVMVNGIDAISAFRVISNFRFNLFGHEIKK